MIHRHLQLPEDMPPEGLPGAAIVDILERGELADWRPLAAAVAAHPFGALANRVVDLLDAFPMHGTSPLWRSFIDRCRAREEGRRESRQHGRSSAGLAALRRHEGLTQVQLAGRLDMSQSDLSKLERRSDTRLSTLRNYAAALGGRLRVLYESDSTQVELGMPGADDGH